MSHPTCASCINWRIPPAGTWEIEPGWGYCVADRDRFDIHAGGGGGDLVTAPDFYCAAHSGVTA